MAKRKKNSLTLRYHRACQAALHNKCVAWIEGDSTCLIDMVRGSIVKVLPKDVFDALTEVPHKWTVQIVAAGESDRKYTKGVVVQTSSRQYVNDLTDIIQTELAELKESFNVHHIHRVGMVAIPRIEDISEAKAESILDSLGLWEQYKMTTKEAIESVLKTSGLTKYALAKSLGAQPPSVYQWLRRTRMSKAYADKFFDLYKLQITDTV